MKASRLKGMVYGGSLIVVGALAVWISSQDHVEATVVEAKTIGHSTVNRLHEPEQLILELPPRTFPSGDVTQALASPFSTLRKAPTAEVPAAPPPVSAPVISAAAPPLTPALPFTFRGFVLDSNGDWLVQLSWDKRFFVAGPGDVIEGLYRIEDRAETEIYLTYLPTSTKQSLPVVVPAGKPNS